jgi:hypothetical protein
MIELDCRSLGFNALNCLHPEQIVSKSWLTFPAINITIRTTVVAADDICLAVPGATGKKGMAWDGSKVQYCHTV